MNPKVSVIIPTYNRAHLLPRAIRSVLNQTFQDFELIIVDDGSTDKTRQIVEEFERQDPRIKYIWQENSGGPARAINSGLKIAQNGYVALLEDDDEWLSEKLEKQMEIFQNLTKENLGFVGCNVLLVNEKTGKAKEINLPRYDDKIFLEKLLAGKFFFNLSMLLFKKEVLNKVGFFDENLKHAADQDIFLRVAQKYNFDFVTTPLLKYHIHKGNISMAPYYNYSLNDWLFMLKKHKDLYQLYPEIYSQKLRNIGTLYMLSGNPKKARQFFLQAINVHFMNFQAYLNFLLSFLGKKIYLHLLNLKKKISFNFLSYV